MRLSFLPLLLLALPLAEIAVFVMVGGEIGVLATIGLILATTLAGVLLLRVQGFGTVQRLQAAVENGGTPGRELAHGAMIVLAAFLLILPGFITDVLGFLLFVPWLREQAWRLLRNRVTVVTSFSRSSARRSPTIDLDEDEFTRHGDTPPGGDDAPRLPRRT